VPGVLAPQKPEVMRTLRAIAQRVDAPLLELHHDFFVKQLPNSETASGDWGFPHAEVKFEDSRAYPGVLGLRGEHQIENWAMAVRLADFAHQSIHGKPLPKDAVLASRTVAQRWPGRLEIVLDSGLKSHLLLDGAHNDHSLRVVLGEVLNNLPRKRPLVVVFGCAKDKDSEAMLRVLKESGVARLVFTHAGNPRSKDAAELAAEWRDAGGGDCKLCPQLSEALSSAEQLAGTNGLILVTGSLYLVGAVKDLLAARGKNPQSRQYN
jgi:dihydrofolate synthase / folylpolyglutamate synthase